MIMFINPWFFSAIWGMQMIAVSQAVAMESLKIFAASFDAGRTPGKWEGNIYYPTIFGGRHHRYSFELAPVVGIKDRKRA